MMRWQDHLTDTEDHSGEADDVAADSATTATLEVPGPSGSLSPGKHGDLDVTKDAAVGDKSIHMPKKDQSTTILPGDIVYISQQTEERLLYTKAVYLGSNGQKPIAREWNSKQEVEVSMPALVRKTSFTEEERLEAEYVWATSALEGREGQVGPRHYRRNILLSSRTIDELKTRAHLLETGEVELQEYDEGLVKPIFSKFLQQINIRDSAHGLPLEDVVRTFYATTTSYFSGDNASTDQIWKADVERSAALLMDVLIGIIREGSDHSDEELAQIKAEHGQMIARASQAVKGARGDYIKQSVGDLQDALDHLEIDFETLEAFKVRAQGVATGQEQLPGFDDKHVRQTFVEFSQKLATAPPRARHLVVEVMQEFESCVLSELIQLGRLDVGSTAATEVLLRQKALLLSLLISVDAQLQFQHHGSAPRIRSRFTSLLMEERATYLLAISEVQTESRNQPSSPEADTAADLSRDQRPSPTTSIPARDVTIYDVSSEEVDVDHPIEPHMEPPAIERPPRVMKCYQCQHSWTSTIASDLRDCPECGSYSVFADSPRRTASPDDTGSPHILKAPGEEAMGQYFSERTDKYMSLYRDKQPSPGSKQNSQESFPDPWSHLHGSHSSTSLPKAGRITQEPPVADLHAIMCYRCGYRFSRPSGLETVDCPKCSTKETFVDFFPAELEDSNLTQNEGTGTSTQALHDALLELARLLDEIEDLVSDLQQLEDRHSSIVADVPGAVEQLLLISAAFKLLIKLKYDPDHHIRYQQVEERLQILRSSIQYTLDTASEVLRSRPLDETQWSLLCHRMKSDENVEFLDRLRWYQKSISGLNGHVEGSTSMVSPDYNATNIEVLLWRQRTIRGHQPDNTSAKLRRKQSNPSVTAPGSISCYYCQAQLSDVYKNATCPNCGSWTIAPSIPEILERMEIGEAQLVQQEKASETAESARLHYKRNIRSKLEILIGKSSEARLHLYDLDSQHLQTTTNIPAMNEQLLGLRNNFALLSQLLQDESRHDPNETKLQELIQIICHSTHYTLNDIVDAWSLGDSNEAKLEAWTLLMTRMSDVEKAELQGRLVWYRANVLSLLNYLEGLPSTGEVSRWAMMGEEMTALLERQKLGRGAYTRSAGPTSSHSDHPRSTDPPVNLRSESTGPPVAQIPQEYISRLLSGLITHAGDAATRLHTLNEQYPHNSTRTGGIEGQLSGLCAGFRRLAKHHEDARNDQEFDKMQAVVQEICHSAQYTLDDILGVFDTGSDATRWESWTQLTTRMNHLEKAGLNERLKWYLNSMLDLLHHLEGNTRSVRLGQWMSADEKIAALLERQEMFRKTSPARHE
jgi:Zn finger protein HypA/HybF involved in hydrogenase expression